MISIYEIAAIIIALFSMVMAIAAAWYARRSAVAAERTVGVELLGQLYTLYQAEEMNKNLSIVWTIYKKIWVQESGSKEIGIKNANNGVPITLESATQYFNQLKEKSKEFKAIHYTLNFWTYLELLIKRDVLTQSELSAFTSPYILGFLSPIAKAYDLRYPDPDDQKSNLEYAYELLVVDREKKRREN